MKIKNEIERDMPSRLKFTEFEDGTAVSTVDTTHPIQNGKPCT